MREKVAYLLAALGAAVLVRNLYLIFLVMPDEAAQGLLTVVLLLIRADQEETERKVRSMRQQGC
jgi:hypothetical protein